MEGQRIIDEITKVRRKLIELENARVQAEAAGNVAKSSDIQRRISQKLVELENLMKIAPGEPL